MAPTEYGSTIVPTGETKQVAIFKSVVDPTHNRLNGLGRPVRRVAANEMEV